MSIFMSISLSFCLSLIQSACLSAHLFVVCQSIFLCICLFQRLSVCLSVCLSSRDHSKFPSKRVVALECVKERESKTDGDEEMVKEWDKKEIEKDGDGLV